MSLFGALMGDLDEDPFFGHHMRSMRQMNSLMNSFIGDTFPMLSPFDNFGPHSALTGAASRNTSLMPLGFQSMPNINRLLSPDGLPCYPVQPHPTIPRIDIGGAAGNGPSFCSSSFISMTQGPDGRPQVYQATSSLKTGPGGVRETRKTVQDSRSGLKKMAIGHHIGERAHIIEREQNYREGTQEERQDFINLEEDEAEDFDREFLAKAQRGGPGHNGARIGRIEAAPASATGPRQLPALPAPPTSTPATSATTPSSRRQLRNISKVSSRRALRTPTSSPLALPPNHSSTTSVHPHPYNPAAARRNFRSKKLSSQLNNSPDRN